LVRANFPLTRILPVNVSSVEVVHGEKLRFLVIAMVAMWTVNFGTASGPRVPL